MTLGWLQVHEGKVKALPAAACTEANVSVPSLTDKLDVCTSGNVFKAIRTAMPIKALTMKHQVLN